MNYQDKVFIYEDATPAQVAESVLLADAGVWAALERLSCLDNGAPGLLVSQTMETATPWAEILESVDWFAESEDADELRSEYAEITPERAKAA